SMEYLGRMDEQVKIRGYRIELGEIEQVLIQQAGIRDAAVIIRKDAAADPYICAYVVKTTEAEGLEPGEIKKALQRQLPDYMIPSRIIEVEKLPVTVNGKLDRRKLPEPVFSVGSEYTAPRNAEEAMLAEIFEQILGMERIGIDDSFFELGGNSLKAIGVISRVRSHGYSLSLLDLLKNSTVSALADCLKTVESGQARTQEVLDVHALNEQLEQLIGEEVRVLVDESGQETAVFVKDEVYVLSKEEMINRIQDSHPLLVPTVLLPFSIYQDLHIADGSGLDRLMDKHYPADVNHYVQLASDRMKEYASNWLAQPEVTRYPLSSIQKVSFILGVRSSYAELNFDRRLDVGRLEQALLQMLRLHPLLRSKIDIRPDSEHIVVVDVPSAVRIPLVDLTYMSKQMKGIITDGVRQLYRAFYEEERYTGDSLSHGLILLKKNEGSFTLLMPCTHLIFDGMSNESFCNQLLACYEDSESARDQEVQPYDYFNYIQQTGMGPRHITEDEIINTLELDLFAAAVRNYRHMTQGVTFRTVEYQFNMRDLDISGSQEQMWRLSGEIYTAVMRFFFPEAQIPVFVVHTGRKLMEQEYYDYIGEFIDLLPCVIDTGRDAALHENITNKIDFLRAHNINIASLLDNKAIQSNYPNVAAALSTVDLHHMNIPSYNYLAIYNHLQGAVLEDPNRITRTEHESDAFTFEHTSTNVVMIGETIYISTMCKEGCETELEDYLAGILQHMQGSQQYAQKIPVYEFIR
ncbi:condensation domain-containing protein, partial [Paenibacillus cellulosilyticus]